MRFPTVTCAVFILVVIGLSSCTERGDSTVADTFTVEILSPWWLRPESKDAELAREFRALAKSNRADPRRIPADVITRVAAMTEIKADSLVSLLAVTGLAPYRSISSSSSWEHSTRSCGSTTAAMPHFSPPMIRFRERSLAMCRIIRLDIKSNLEKAVGLAAEAQRGNTWTVSVIHLRGE